TGTKSLLFSPKSAGKRLLSKTQTGRVLAKTPPNDSNCPMAFGWEGKNIRLVPLDFEAHYENCCKWMNDPELTQWLLVGDFPMTRLAEKEWFESALKRDGQSGEIMFAIELLN